MQDEVATGLSVVALLCGFPVLLLATMVLLQRLEDWMLQSDERASQVHTLLEHGDVEEIESEVASMLVEYADRPGNLVRSRRRRGD